VREDGSLEVSSILTLNEESGNKGEAIFRRQKERKSTRNHERGGRTAEKHGETEETEKSRKQFQAPSPTPKKPEEKSKTQSQGKPDGPSDRLAILAAG
jgi:hypothetical protein